MRSLHAETAPIKLTGAELAAPPLLLRLRLRLRRVGIGFPFRIVGANQAEPAGPMVHGEL